MRISLGQCHPLSSFPADAQAMPIIVQLKQDKLDVLHIYNFSSIKSSRPQIIFQMFRSDYRSSRALLLSVGTILFHSASLDRQIQEYVGSIFSPFAEKLLWFCLSIYFFVRPCFTLWCGIFFDWFWQFESEECPPGLTGLADQQSGRVERGETGQIHFARWTNTFCNVDKYIFKVDKYILQGGQIHFAMWTNTCSRWTKTFFKVDKYTFARWTNTLGNLNKYV